MIHWINLLFLGTVGWGFSLYLIKILLISLSPIEIVLYRLAIGTLSLFSLVIIFKIQSDNRKYLIRDGFVVGLFNMAIPIYLTAFVEEAVSSTLVSIINGLTPLFTFLIGTLFITSKQTFDGMLFFSVLFGFFGIVIVNADFYHNQIHFVDLLSLLAMSLSYGIAANYIKFVSKKNNPILLSAVSAGLSTLVMLMCKLMGPESLHWHFPQNGVQVMALSWLGIVGSGLGLYFYYLLIQHKGPAFASLVTYLMIVTGVIAGTVLLHETISGITALGCILILASLVMANHFHRFSVRVKRNLLQR